MFARPSAEIHVRTESVEVCIERQLHLLEKFSDTSHIKSVLLDALRRYEPKPKSRIERFKGLTDEREIGITSGSFLDPDGLIARVRRQLDATQLAEVEAILLGHGYAVSVIHVDPNHAYSAAKLHEVAVRYSNSTLCRRFLRLVNENQQGEHGPFDRRLLRIGREVLPEVQSRILRDASKYDFHHRILRDMVRVLGIELSHAMSI